jgi:hypothetical protein
MPKTFFALWTNLVYDIRSEYRKLTSSLVTVQQITRRIGNYWSTLIPTTAPDAFLVWFLWCGVLCTFCNIPAAAQQLGLPPACSWAAPCQRSSESRHYIMTWQAIRASHHSKKLLPLNISPPSRLGRTPCWVGSLRPLASVGTTLYNKVYPLKKGRVFFIVF